MALLNSAPPLELNPPLVPGGDVESFQISPDGARVVYLADLEVDERVELFLTRIGGGATVKLNGPLEDDVTSFAIAPDSAQVLFLGEARDYTSLAELFACPIVQNPAGASTPTETVVRQQ